MLKKVYEKVKRFIIENHNFLLFLILFTIVLNIKVPYVVSAPGGIIPLSDKVTVNGKSIKNNFYTTYVKVYDGNVASFLVGKIMPKWDVEKESSFTGNTKLTYEELNEYERLLLKQSNLVATILAFNEAKVEYTTEDNKLYILYKIDGYDNNLKIGDQIVTCDELNTPYFSFLQQCISNSSDKSIDLEVIRDGKKMNIAVPLYSLNGENVIGINVLQDFNIKSDLNVKIQVDKDESGSSGGFLTALSIYDAITNKNLSKGLKVTGTGTIDENGLVGPIGGVKYKLLGANKKHVDVFFIPKDNFDEAMKIKKKYKLKLKIVKVEKFSDAIDYLNKLKK